MSEASGTSWVTGEFLDRTLEREFNRSRERTTAHYLRIVLIVAAGFFLLFAYNDYRELGLSTEFWFLWGVRLVPVAGALWMLAALARRPALAVAGLPVTALEIVALTAFLAIMWVRPAAIPWHATAMTIILFALYLTLPNRPVLSLTAGTYALFGFLTVGAVSAHISSAHMVRYALLLLMANAFAYFSSVQLNRLRRAEYVVLRKERAARLELEREVDHRRELERGLTELATTDSLTGLLNRRQFVNLSNHEVLRASRSGRPLSVCLFDLDHFKQVNDVYGHDAGDAVLKAVAEAVCRTVRKGDVAGRYGGEEFTLTLPDTNLDAAFELAERLRRTIAEARIPRGGDTLQITATFGVAAFHPQETTVEAALSRADKALYRGKADGRNRIELESPPTAGAATE